MKKRLLQTSVLVLLVISGFSQANRYWSPNTQSRFSIIADKATSRLSFPTDAKLYNLNFEPFKQALMSIVDKRSASMSTIISIPNAAGSIEEFEVYEASNFDQALQNQFPQIRAFSGRGITDKYATLKLSISPRGIQTMVFRIERNNEFIEPFSEDHAVYAVYTSHREKGKIPWRCTTADGKMTADLNGRVATASTTARSTGDLKTMRLAQSVTAEYSNYFGATSSANVGLVLAAINNTLTRCNGVYEKDLAVHLNLIANTTAVIYYNKATDPYSPASTGAAGNWNSELQNTLTSVIGEANYDIGHLFGASGGGGNAGCIGCICVNGQKGSGYTSPADAIPEGDNFDIDYVVHEVGHQMGANHTFSMSNESSGVNKEVGSGITIMGYAGITSQDVAPHSIAMYHAASIAQIQANLGTKLCPVTTTITNATPVVGTLVNYTIPKSTPFALTGSATDADAGDVLTYCWEQNDNASGSQTGANSVAKPTKANGPNWISFAPSTSPTRYFPKLATILAGGLTSGPLPGGDAGVNTEALSSVARTLNFRLTVRDNAIYRSTAPVSVGQTNYKDMAVTVSAAAGPFSVTSPNTGLSWGGGTSQTITWNVASSNAAPVSCANVKISLSTDGGQSFPTILAASTPNDGSQSVTIPNIATTKARIKIEAVGNIFFDISNANFTITSATACGTPSGLTTSAITGTGATVAWTAVSSATSYDVGYKLTSSSTWTAAATATTATSVNLSGLAAGNSYTWRVRANCTNGSSAYTTSQFTTSGGTNCTTAFEPNETRGTAAAITSGVINSAAITSSTDVDYFKITTTATSNLTYNLIGPSGKDYELFIYNSGGSLIGSSEGSTATETVSLSNQAAGTYYIKVIGYKGSNSTTCYTIKATSSTATLCQSSLDHPSNGSISAAATIPFNTSINGLISPSNDIDNYKFVITSGGTITISLTTLPADYDLVLLNNEGTQVAISEHPDVTNESITYNAAPGTYYVGVYGYNGLNNASSCYTLTIQQETTTFNLKATVKGTVSIYPNPVHDMVKINMGAYTEPTVADITDMYGRRILNKTFTGMTSIDMSKLASGVYMVTIRDKNGVIIKQEKMVKE